jgi:uncharacterized protein (TIGR00251 family)
VITLREHAQGSVLSVRVQPGARKAGVKGEQAGNLKIAVTAPPVEGKANVAVIEFLAEILGVKRGQIELIAGATSREKAVLIRGLTSEEIRARLRMAIPARK